jgi:preprotein translocase subunit YajC
MAFRMGDRVRQHAYGVGDITAINADYITIAFDDGTTRKFAAARVRLQISDAPRLPAPTKAAPRRKRAASSA